MKEKKPLPKFAMPALSVVVGLIIGVVGWMLVVSPQGKKAAELKKQTAAVEQTISDNRAATAAAAAAASAVTTPKIKIADVYKLAKAMPSSTDMPNILLELSQVTRAAGVGLSTIGPAPAVSVGAGYSKIPITMSVTGDFYSVTDLLYRLRTLVSVRGGALEAAGRLFTIDTVNLTPSARTVTANLTLSTFVYGGGTVVPSAATTASTDTASTDTTSTDTTSTDTTSSPDNPPAGPSAAGAP